MKNSAIRKGAYWLRLHHDTYCSNISVIVSLPPATGSIVAESDYGWQDAEWLEHRAQVDTTSEAMSIYEVHLGSWRWGRNYADLATELVDYVADLGYTHVEFMPVSEHPFGGSWGYQVSGYYAPTSRWGTPDEFRELVAEAHRRGVKVIVDVVPHLNRRSSEVPDDCVVQCYDENGRLVARASTDGRYGSWNDGKLFNYRKFEVWEWLERSITTLIERFDVDGIRFDSAHAVPIMMKKNNYPSVYGLSLIHI